MNEYFLEKNATELNPSIGVYYQSNLGYSKRRDILKAWKKLETKNMWP